MSDSIINAAAKFEAAILINNELFTRMVEKSIRVAGIEAEWCYAVRAAPESGPTRAAYEKKTGALRRLKNWKRGLATLADKIIGAQTALSRGGADAFEVSASNAYAFAVELQSAIDIDCEAAAEAAERRRWIQEINTFEAAYAAAAK